jgi:hypothetical protein
MLESEFDRWKKEVELNSKRKVREETRALQAVRNADKWYKNYGFEMPVHDYDPELDEEV